MPEIIPLTQSLAQFSRNDNDVYFTLATSDTDSEIVKYRTIVEYHVTTIKYNAIIEKTM